MLEMKLYTGKFIYFEPKFANGEHQPVAFFSTNAGILLIRFRETAFCEILCEIHIFSLKTMLLKMSFAKWCQFCIGLNVFIAINEVSITHVGDFSVFELSLQILDGNLLLRNSFFIGLTFPMMTLSNGNIFRVTGLLCRELTGLRWIPRTKASDDVFFDLHRIKRLSKHSRGWWSETLSHPLWRHCNKDYMRGVSSYVTGCLCGVWCRGLTTLLSSYIVVHLLSNPL